MALEPTGGPETARIGGRRSGIIGAVVVVGVLVAVIWVGASGRPAAPIVPPTDPAVAALPSVAPTPTAVEPSSRPTQFVIGQPDGPTSLVGDDVYGAYAQFGTNQYITILTESEPNHLVGRLGVELPLEEGEGTLVFEQFSRIDRFIGKWPINVETLAADSPVVVVVDTSTIAQSNPADAPRPVLRGFHLTVTAQRTGKSGELLIDVRIGPIIASGPPRVDRPAVVTYDRTRGRYNYCRWDVTPLSAPPRPGTDEAAC